MMHTRYSVVPRLLRAGAMIVFLGLVPGLAAGQQVLDISDLLQRVLSENRDLERALLEEQQAEAGYRSARASIGPQVELDVNPLTVDNRRVQQGSAPGVAPIQRTVRTASAGATLRYVQALPAGGRLVGETGLELSRSRSIAEDEGEDDTIRFEASPQVSLRFSQPVFVRGSFIDTRIASAIDTQARTGVRIAELTRRDLENRFALAATELYFAIADLRRAVPVQEERLELTRRQIARTRDDVEAGAASRQQLLQLQLAENGLRDALLQTREQLRNLERSLFRISGGTVEAAEYAFRAPGDILSSAAAELPDSTDVSANPDVARAQVSLESAVAERRVNRSDRAPELSAFAQISRRYPDTRDDPSDAVSAFTDLFDGDGGFTWTAGLNLTVPLVDGGRRRTGAEVDDRAVRLAELERAESEENVRDDILAARERVSILRDRVALLQAEADFAADRRADLEALVEIAAATDLEVDEARLDQVQAQNAVIEAQGELVLLIMELNALTGGQASAAVSPSGSM